MPRRLAVSAGLSLALLGTNPAHGRGQSEGVDAFPASSSHSDPAPSVGVASVGTALGVAPVERLPFSIWEHERDGTGALPQLAAFGAATSTAFRVRTGPERRIQASETPSVAKPVVLSAVVPGVGQLTLGQRRGWLYLALEAVAWGFYLDRRAAGVDGRDAYRDFAWEEARLHAQPRVEGEFDYYETMSKWDRSGAYDVDPDASGVQPESDMTTYNGNIWTRATGIFVPGDDPPEVDPGYQRALAYYSDRAYRSAFLWDWRGDEGARGTYTDMIKSSDDYFRQATNVLGAIIANHLVSAVDAFFSARGMSTPVEARFAPMYGSATGRWTAFVSVSGAP